MGLITLARKKALIVGVGHEPRVAGADVHAMHQGGAMLCRTWNIETSRPCTELLHPGVATTVIRDVNGHQGRARLQIVSDRRAGLLCAFLISDKASAITGTTLYAGGYASPTRPHSAQTPYGT